MSSLICLFVWIQNEFDKWQREHDTAECRRRDKKPFIIIIIIYGNLIIFYLDLPDKHLPKASN